MTQTTLKDVGLKVTRPRARILEMLETSDQKHLSAEDVYQRLLQQGEEIGLATIYRVLTQFESAGIVQRHYFEAGTAVFEMSPHGHHDHLVCVRCGRVVEFCDPIIEQRQRQMAEDHGFRMEDHALVIYGRCDDAECGHEEE